MFVFSSVPAGVTSPSAKRVETKRSFNRMTGKSSRKFMVTDMFLIKDRFGVVSSDFH